MLPLKTNLPTRWLPVATLCLIGINVLTYLVDTFAGRDEAITALTADGTAVQVMHHVGALSPAFALYPNVLTSHPAAAWYTIITSMFLHANLLHIAGNMLFLWMFGRNVEDALGRTRYLAFYVISGIGAAALQIVSAPHSQLAMVGASGAIAGVMAAYLILFPGVKVLALVPIGFLESIMEVPAVIVIGLWAVLQFANATWLGGGSMQGGGVAYFAHVGGFATGIAAILAMGGKQLAYQIQRPPVSGYFT